MGSWCFSCDRSTRAASYGREAPENGSGEHLGEDQGVPNGRLTVHGLRHDLFTRSLDAGARTKGCGLGRMSLPTMEQ